jgi:hypothetical protein
LSAADLSPLADVLFTFEMSESRCAFSRGHVLPMSEAWLDFFDKLSVDLLDKLSIDLLDTLSIDLLDTLSIDLLDGFVNKTDLAGREVVVDVVVTRSMGTIRSTPFERSTFLFDKCGKSLSNFSAVGPMPPTK